MKFNTKKDGSGKFFDVNPSNEIARGGEGWVTTIDSTDLVAKIYHDNISQRITDDKFKELTKLPSDKFITPKSILYDDHGKSVGFIMDYVDINGFYPIERIYKKVFCQQKGINDKVKTKIVNKIISSVKEAHSLGVVIGDLNPYNILANKKGDVYFIDVDSYQTPSAPHTGILLEDITDYLYKRKVSKESDYFALSCVVFNMVTLVHPFKGVHNVFKSIKNRMINKTPVFKKGEKIKIPKFYQPIKERHLMEQFESFYLKGKRAMLSIDEKISFIATSPLAKPEKVLELDEDSIKIKEVIEDSLIYDVFVLENRFIVKSQIGFKLYSSYNKGYVTLERSISKKEYDDVFIGVSNTVAKKGLSLYDITDKVSPPVEITNFKFESKAIIDQQRNVIIAQNQLNSKMDLVSVDNIFGKAIEVKQQVVNSKNMNMLGGMFHTAGGKNMLVNIDTNASLNFILFPFNVKEVYQVGDVGVVKYANEKGKIEIKYYKLKGLKAEFSLANCGDMYNFGYMAGTGHEGFIFQPQDGFIRIIRTNDFEEVSRLDCSLCTSQSFVKNTGSGLIMWENGRVLLVNKK